MSSGMGNFNLADWYGCAELLNDVTKKLGDELYSRTDATAIGFILALKHNYTFDLSSKGDLLLHNATNSVYDMKYISTDSRSVIEEKRKCYREVLMALTVHAASNKYISYAAWNMKYCDIALRCLDLYNKNVTASEGSIINFVSRAACTIVEELGYVNLQALLHIIIQLTGAPLEDNTLVGHVLQEDVKCGGVTLAYEGSVVTKDLHNVVSVLGLRKIKIKPINEAVQHLVDMPVLGSMEMRLLKLLPYRDRLAILTRRIKYLCEHPELKFYVDTVRDMGDYEWQHAMNVALLSGIIAIEMQVRPRVLNHILLGGILHDIGKSKVPASVLTAARRLTSDELQLIRQHPTYGAEILKGLPKPVVEIAGFHHACNDGWGYPPVTNIPKTAAIVHIVDVYDAMCRERDYKKPYDRNFVRKHINSHAGWFDAEVLKAFNEAIKIFSPGETAFISGTPCTFFDFKDGKYVFFADSINQFIHFTEEEIKDRLTWNSSMEM